ncbi:HAD family hydrolase [Anaerostipes sp.]|uniref:HAD family hydrolase n=1 Tax=Anaerostipes sp. TaxID=1872530 RepID=UPI0025C29AF7|nr:HAD family phosphatase [Anaerostipes sp.]MBS7007537.1 HAD family phosphatase [Anaerostipes sp.]
MLKAVIFDMDGVIVDSEPGYYTSLLRLLDEFDAYVDEEYNARYFGTTMEKLFTDTIEYLELDTTVDYCNERFFEIYEEVVREEGFTPIKGTIELIREIHEAGIPMAVASSSPMDHIKRITEDLGVSDFFHELVTGEDCENSKPDPEIFLTAAQKLGVEPEHCAVVEDSANGVLAGTRAGMKVLGFSNPEYGSPSHEKAHKVVHSLEEADLKTLESLFTK